MNALQFWSVLLFAMLLIGSCIAAFLTKKKGTWIVAAIISGLMFVYLLGTIFLDFEVKNPFVAQTISADEITYDRSSEKPDCVTCGFDKKDLIAPEAQIPSQQQQIIVNNGTVAEKPVAPAAPVAAEPAAKPAAVEPAKPAVPVEPVTAAPATAEKLADPVVEKPIVPAVTSVMKPLDLEFGTFTEGKWSTGQVDVKWVTTNACDFVYRAWRGVKPNIYDTNPIADLRYNTPWVHLFCGTEGTSDSMLRLDHPTVYQISSTELRFTIVRDLAANGASNPSPYLVALSGDPNLQSGKSDYKKELSLYIMGKGQIELADGSWLELNPAIFWQIPFPENLDRGIVFHMKNFKGELWQGSQELLDGGIHSPIVLPMIDLK